ncbi:MAG: nitrous oxide reductase accessory protein NosL [Bacteroidetes bacterium]|nr:nitrous oxide reductase accessory protein NosL [Bacteroidota bacterium]
MSKRVVILGFMLVVLAGCALEPQPLDHGHDRCAYCKMTLSDEQYGAELITSKGKFFTFDSVECLASHLATADLLPDHIHSLWVVDYENPPQLIPVDEAFFLHSRDLPSPMGMNLTAFGPGITQQAVQHSFFGEILDWQGVDSLVRVSMSGDRSMHLLESMQP